jgi:hypothetical protein
MDSNTYTTGEMIDLISKDNELIFEAVSGMYDGNIVAFHEGMGWLMWKGNNTYDYEPINLSDDFMNTKWKLLSRMYVLRVECPLKDVARSYCLC